MRNFPNHVNKQRSASVSALLGAGSYSTQGLSAQIINSVASSQGWSGATTTEPPSLWENDSVLDGENAFKAVWC